jgi:hypothetical protein
MPAVRHLISERGIEGNPEKIQAIINMQPEDALTCPAVDMLSSGA